jgi:hypothetical protein
VSFEVELVLGVLFGLAGWQYAIHLEHKYGVPAWGLPSWAWGLITGFSLLLGAVLMAVAERALAKEPEDAPLGLEAYAAEHAAAVAAAAAAAPVAVQGFPVVPAQAVAQEPVPVPVPVAAVPAPVPAAGPPAGWHPDPSGKYQHRWWDGQRWTADVSTNGVAGRDV